MFSTLYLWTPSPTLLVSIVCEWPLTLLKFEVGTPKPRTHVLKNSFLFQLFSIVDLLSYIGGVLGLCLGFSAMSCLECMYFFTVRLGLNVRMNRDEPDVSGGLFDNH